MTQLNGILPDARFGKTLASISLHHARLYSSGNKLEALIMTIVEPKKHTHQHGPGCGHLAVQHQGHIDYLHDGHLHHQEGQRVEEHVIDVDQEHPDQCNHQGKGHTKSHVHGPNCGHETVPHGDHTDYLVDGRLHHAHEGHCDDHGPLEVVS
ncbi:MAG: hypothetical protein JWM68_3343 [Verrucomicrobiales bacterium]|nr:hypothetical protein [Verrucomicrobiales bacterium]